MLTYARLVTLERSLRDERVLSVYLHGAAEDPANRLVWRRELDRSLKDLRRWLIGSSHAEREQFERCVEILEERLAPHAHGLAAAGWAAFITVAGVQEAGELPVPMPTMSTWSTGMCVAPYMRALKGMRPVIVTIADARSARIYRYREGSVERLETVHAHATIDAPSHMGDVSRAGFHPGVRGETARDAVQRAHAAGTARMLKQVEAAVARYAGRSGWVLTAGTPPVGAHMTHSIGEAAPGRVMELGSLDVHASDAEILAAARQGVSALREEWELRRISEVVAADTEHGLVALGPVATRRALERAQVRELYLTTRYVEDHIADAEDAVRRALDQGATVEEVTGAAAERLDEHGGLGARLRYRLTPSEGPGANELEDELPVAEGVPQ